MRLGPTVSTLSIPVPAEHFIWKLRAHSHTNPLLPTSVKSQLSLDRGLHSGLYPLLFFHSLPKLQSSRHTTAAAEQSSFFPSSRFSFGWWQRVGFSDFERKLIPSARYPTLFPLLFMDPTRTKAQPWPNTHMIGLETHYHPRNRKCATHSQSNSH